MFCYRSSESSLKETTVRPIGIDLFSGAGGMSLGFEQAGFDVVAAVEIDPVHCAAHKFNFPHCSTIPQSISNLSGSDIRKIAALGTRKVDIVFGGAPCQGFSLIGQRILDDPRNGLVKEFLRVVSELNADYFVFENVKGLTVGDHRKILDEFIILASELGYNVQHPWKVLNAAEYGVPQHRNRLFLLGTRQGKSAPQYPTAITKPADGKAKSSNDIPLGPSVFDAISDLPNADDFETLRYTDNVKTARWGEPSIYASEMRCISNRAWHFGYVRNWRPDILTSSTRTEHTRITKSRFSETPNGQIEPISRFYKLDRNGLSNTLRAGTDSARGAFTSPRPIHFQYHRCVTVREMARLHGFPDWFRFHETKWHGARQIGNSVPPPLARAVASEIIKIIGSGESTPLECIDLGDPKLLSLTVLQAAKYFEIDAPEQRRNRKSGAKKRSQEETERERVLKMEIASG